MSASVDPLRESSEQRFARALEAAAAYRDRRARGEAEDLDVLLGGHADLRDLLEPMVEDRSEPALSSAEPVPVLASQPDRFAHFDLVELLGSGGMGEVYLARDRRLQRTVALKLIQGAGLWSPEALERFRREARVVARLDHPHICKLYEAGEHAGWPFLALQYIEGETLARRLAQARAAADARGDQTSRGPRTREEVAATIATLETVARAVHHAHELGVIHRDLKPGNIMLTGGEEPVVLDFGLARDVRSLDASLSSSSRPIGTPLYMAPEQIELAPVDRHTDVYALGVILYECLTLERPFEGQTERELQDRILGSDPVPVDRRNRAVSRDLAVVVGKAMEKEPARRYRTALQLAEDLARVRARQPVLARPLGVPGRLERWLRRNPLVASCLVALTAGLLASLSQYHRAESHLDRFLQMRDLPLVQDLTREADEELWPAHPDKLPLFDDWLARARRAEARLDGHRAALAELRQRALPASPELLREEQELAALRKELDETEALLAQAAASGRSGKRARLAQHIADLEPRVLPRQAAFDRQRWQFAAAEDRFAHDKLADLVGTTEALVAPGRGRIASVVARRRAAATLAARSVGDEHGSEEARQLAAAWRAAAQRVAQDARFAGVALRPQVGLQPLGPDPESQLEEFAHLLSGEPAARDEEGKLEMGDETGIVLVLIPGGIFQMGAQSSDPKGPNYDPQAAPNASPVHDVSLDPYLIAKHEMTQGQWQRIAGRNPSSVVCRDARCATMLHPVEDVSARDCAEMLRRLGLVLPTEAQWERAARAGTDTPWWTGRDRLSVADAANVADASRKRWQQEVGQRYDEDLDDGSAGHARVGAYRANRFGLWDVIGNVCEWCGDDYAHGYELAARAGDGRREDPSSSYCAMRGGSMGDIAVDARSALRHFQTRDVGYVDVGCRPARALVGAASEAPIVVPSPATPTIQSAIDAAPLGSTIHVLPGTYFERLDLRGKAITLASRGGPTTTILDGGGRGPVIRFARGETRATTLRGFRIRNGHVTGLGGGIAVVHSSPTIQGCDLADNSAHYGGGMGVFGSSSPLIEDCRFLFNAARVDASKKEPPSGGGIAVVGDRQSVAASSPVIRRCEFRGNSADVRGGGSYGSFTSGTIEDCLFVANSTPHTGPAAGAAIFAGQGSALTIRNSVFTGNSTPRSTGAIGVYNAPQTSIVSCTIADNDTRGGLDVFAVGKREPLRVDVANTILWRNGTPEIRLTTRNDAPVPVVDVRHCVITGGHAGIGNLDVDPRLANVGSGNARLLPGSPCLDAGLDGHTALSATDFEGDARRVGPCVDIGADEVVPTRVLLYADRAALSLASASITTITIEAGPARAGQIHAVVAGLAGRAHDLALRGLHQPLSLDPMSGVAFAWFPCCGLLDAAGRAAAAMRLAAPLPACLAGQEISFAAATMTPALVTAWSNADRVRLGR